VTGVPMGAKDNRTALVIKRADSATQFELGQRCRVFANFHSN